MPVPESDVPYIEKGGQVQIHIDATGKTITGKIVRFTRSLDSSTRTMTTEVDIPNPDLSLSPGMYAETTIQLQARRNVLILPAQAVVQNGNSTYVLALNSQNQIQRRDVTIGLQTPNEIEIDSGLEEGDRIIAAGQSNFQVGQTVRPKFITPLRRRVTNVLLCNPVSLFHFNDVFDHSCGWRYGGHKNACRPFSSGEYSSRCGGDVLFRNAAAAN
jgi:multidrug efflux pump subunit AcrA (membrane-fusion protein)